MIQPSDCGSGAAARISVPTRFGPLEADADAIVHFPNGLPGFERCRRFVVLSSPALGALRCLHAVDGPGALFFAIDPRVAMPGFRAVLSHRDRARVGVHGDECLLWLALVTIDDEGRAHANLRAPIVINPATMTGIQSLSHDSQYPLCHPVALG